MEGAKAKVGGDPGVYEGGGGGGGERIRFFSSPRQKGWITSEMAGG